MIVQMLFYCKSSMFYPQNGNFVSFSLDHCGELDRQSENGLLMMLQSEW